VTKLIGRSSNPIGKPKNSEAPLREKQLRFIGASLANTFSTAETMSMVQQEFGISVTQNAIRYYFDLYREFGPLVEAHLKGKDLSLENVEAAVEAVKPRSRRRLVPFFHELLNEKRRIVEDPTYDVAYASKRRRLLKLDQNIRELDEPKTFMKGSYPTARYDDGSITFKEFEIKNKDHAEQRKTIEKIGELTDGQLSGEVVINIHEPVSDEEIKSRVEIEAEKKMADLKARKNAGKSPTKSEGERKRGKEAKEA
jgi:hypothetical protein